MSNSSKNILIISPNPWGKMFVSKHHYAVALAALGHKVYFLNPLTFNGFNTQLSAAIGYDNIKIIDTSLPQWAYILRFKAKSIYNYIVNLHIKKILKTTAVHFDEVWCFETNLYPNLSKFKAVKIIYFPADLLMYPYQVKVANKADLCVTISQTIVNSLVPTNKPTLLLPHGLANDFYNYASQKIDATNYNWQPSNTIKVGYVGNLVRSIIDQEAILFLVNKYPNIEFNFWGAYKANDSNLSGNTDSATIDFVSTLQVQKNCILHGATNTADLALQMQQIDAFILTLKIVEGGDYDGSNSHKIIEYLSTGKVFVANFIVPIYTHTNLFEMADSNPSFYQLFDKVINNISNYNNNEIVEKRLQYAVANTYSNHVNTIYTQLYQ